MNQIDHSCCFDRNLLALSTKDKELCEKLSRASAMKGRYRFLESRTGAIVPAIVAANGSAKALHSSIDPDKEAIRIVSQFKTINFLIVFGLGGGFIIRAALRNAFVSGIIVIDYDIDAFCELMATIDFVDLFSDPRVSFMINPVDNSIQTALFQKYHPALAGGISVLPLRARVDQAETEFHHAGEIIRSTIDSISEDYSVQAYFGKRWFANVFRNLVSSDRQVSPLPPIKNAAVVAAGPSLDEQLSILRKHRTDVYVIATDTALPALLAADLAPDSVVAIDCQHIGYYHFMSGLPSNIPLFLDLAAPTSIAARSERLYFFSGDHPLTVYISKHWKSFPFVDTSGGNVTYAAVSLAATLGAQRIELYGADFSYPAGNSYARGTYIHSLFHRQQTRLNTVDNLFCSFLFRNEALKLVKDSNLWRYETKPLSSYKRRLEELLPSLQAELIQIQGFGVSIKTAKPCSRDTMVLNMFTPGKAKMPAHSFISKYRETISLLPDMASSPDEYISRLSMDQKDVLTTILPTAAVIRRHHNYETPSEILKAAKYYCLDQLDRIVKSML